MLDTSSSPSPGSLMHMTLGEGAIVSRGNSTSHSGILAKHGPPERSTLLAFTLLFFGTISAAYFAVRFVRSRKSSGSTLPCFRIHKSTNICQSTPGIPPSLQMVSVSQKDGSASYSIDQSQDVAIEAKAPIMSTPMPQSSLAETIGLEKHMKHMSNQYDSPESEPPTAPRPVSLSTPYTSPAVLRVESLPPCSPREFGTLVLQHHAHNIEQPCAPLASLYENITAKKHNERARTALRRLSLPSPLHCSELGGASTLYPSSNKSFSRASTPIVSIPERTMQPHQQTDHLKVLERFEKENNEPSDSQIRHQDLSLRRCSARS